MFTSDKRILYLTKSLAYAALIKGTASYEISKTSRYQWTTTTLEDLLTTLQQEYNAKTIRVLLADELSYLVELTIPPMPESMEREYIAGQLPALIPETFTQNEWDFKVESIQKNGKKILVFAPIHYIYDALSKASIKKGVIIEAMEPVSLALKRHTNPIIGLAMKKDLKGKDEDVLNIVPSSVVSKSVSTKKPVNKKLVVLIFLSAFLLPLMGIGAFLSLSETENLSPAPTVQPTPVPPSPTPVITEEPTPIPEPPDVSVLTVQVLNGTGKAGASKAVQDILLENGFKTVTTGNAPQLGHKETKVQLKPDVDLTVTEFITSLLPGYTVSENDPLTSSSAYDVLITVGEINE